MPNGLSRLINVTIGVLIIAAIAFLWYNTSVSAILAIAAFLAGFFKREIIKGLT